MAASVPQIVYSNSWSQNTAIASTDLFTPTSDGMFRISVYGNQTSGPANLMSYALTWEDAVGTQEISGLVLGGGTGPADNTLTYECNAYSITVYATTAAAIALSTSVGGGSPSYNLYVEIEAL